MSTQFAACMPGGTFEHQLPGPDRRPQARDTPRPGSHRITIDETSTPDLVIVRVAKPDGRAIRRNVARELWSEAGYRDSTIRSMLAILA